MSPTTPTPKPAAFKTSITISPVDGQGRFWRVERTLVFHSALLGRTLTVKRGFICDLNSMPRLSWIVSPKTDYPAAGALHDWGYRDRHLTQLEADGVYREALIVLGMSTARANGRYYALRTFGHFSYPGVEPMVVLTTPVASAAVVADAVAHAVAETPLLSPVGQAGEAEQTATVEIKAASDVEAGANFPS
jgi:hypothetical protein